jgi:hypothetical protein
MDALLVETCLTGVAITFATFVWAAKRAIDEAEIDRSRTPRTNWNPGSKTRVATEFDDWDDRCRDYLVAHGIEPKVADRMVNRAP